MSQRPDVMELKESMSALAERIANEGFAKKLDYSLESVHEVEAILAVLHNEYVKTHSEEGIHGIALEFGAYLVKLIERHFGPVDWSRDHADFGQDAFPLVWRGRTLFPVTWCLKRIIDGPSDNVWSKFQVLVLEENAHDQTKRCQY